VKIEADIKNTYYDKPPLFNIVGEIPGTDKADEIVMLGASTSTRGTRRRARPTTGWARGHDGGHAHPQSRPA